MQMLETVSGDELTRLRELRRCSFKKGFFRKKHKTDTTRQTEEIT